MKNSVYLEGLIELLMSHTPSAMSLVKNWRSEHLSITRA
jgi:hypothetical protein